MTIFERLRKDHEKHRTLLSLVAKTHGDSTGRRELFEKVRRDMDAHAAAEERCFYARILEDGLTQEKGRHSVAEHKALDDLLVELDEMDFSSPHWLPKFRQFADCAVHHMDEEEHEVFQMAGKVLSESEKRDLVGAFETIKKEELAAIS